MRISNQCVPEVVSVVVTTPKPTGVASGPDMDPLLAQMVRTLHAHLTRSSPADPQLHLLHRHTLQTIPVYPLTRRQHSPDVVATEVDTVVDVEVVAATAAAVEVLTASVGTLTLVQASATKTARPALQTALLLVLADLNSVVKVQVGIVADVTAVSAVDASKIGLAMVLPVATASPLAHAAVVEAIATVIEMVDSPTMIATVILVSLASAHTMVMPTTIRAPSAATKVVGRAAHLHHTLSSAGFSPQPLVSTIPPATGLLGKTTTSSHSSQLLFLA